MAKTCQKPAENDTSVNYFLMGIVSYGPPCEKQDEPGVYTNVSMFMRWIVEHLNFNNSIWSITPSPRQTLRKLYLRENVDGRLNFSTQTTRFPF